MNAGIARVEIVTDCLVAWHDEASEEGIESCRALARHIVSALDGADPYVIAPAWHCEAEATGLQTDPCSAENPIHGPPCGVDQTKPDVDVCKDVRGVWWVTLDGVKVSDHRTHDAARIAARRHQVELISK